jgi:hypothetical protein
VTTLTEPARSEQEPSLRPVPWRRMAWVAWRQHRMALSAVVVLLCALAVCLWITGLQVHHAYAAAIACHPASSIACGDLVTSFNSLDTLLAGGYVLQAVPGLIGAFLGAPVLAQELETGTFRYAWTQGFGRWRWTLAKLVPLAIVAAAAAGAFSVLLSWYYQPYLAARDQALSINEWSPLSGGIFDLRGVSFAAWTLAAFAGGALAGMLIRQVVPAIAATLTGYAGLVFAVALYLRQHYLAPLVARNLLNPPSTAWVLSQWWTWGGRFVVAGDRDAGGMPPPNLLRQVCPQATPGPDQAKPSPTAFVHCLSQHGYTQWTSYQPASRFWPFQWIEGGWLLALSVLLIAATVWLVRRRAT